MISFMESPAPSSTRTPTTSGTARPPISTCCWRSVERGSARHPACAGAADLARLSRLERAAPRTRGGAGTLDSLPHNDAVVTLLAACGSTHGKSHGDLAMVALVGALIALAAAIMLGSAIGPF